MTTQIDLAPAFQKTAEGPFVVEFFMVEGASFRCMAYRDQNGKWRNAFNHGELTGEIQFVE
jgi:hypothetical protein